MPIYNLVYGIQTGPTPPEPWTPGANTIAYYPLESDVNDYLGNYNGTLSSPISYSTVGASLINTAYFGGPRMTTSLTTLPNTINFWLYKSSGGSYVNGWKQILGFNNVDGGNAICIRGLDANKSSGKFYMQVGSTNTEYTYGAYADTRVNICATTDGTTRKLYINGSEVKSVSGGFGTAQTGFWLGLAPYDGTDYAFYGYYSHVILESTTWTAQEIADYYNATREDYGWGQPTTSTYTISNIPTSDVNVYQYVVKSGKTIDSVKFSFTAQYISAQGFFQISGNNNNTNRYGLVFGRNISGTAPAMAIRGRLGGSDSWYRSITDGFDSSGSNTVEYTINRNGSCSVKCNGTTSTYTATGTELTVLQTIMNLSDMNVYCAQNGGSAGSVIVGNTVDVEVTYS